MSILIKDGKIFYQNQLVDMDMFIDNNGKSIIASEIDVESDKMIDGVGCIVIPSLVNPFKKDFDVRKLAGNSVAGGYGVNCIASTNTQLDIESGKYKILNNTVVFTNDLAYISNGKCFGYQTDTISKDILEVLDENKSLLVYTGKDFNQLNNLDLAIYVADVDLADLETIRALKNTNSDFSCGVNIVKMIDEIDNFLVYIKDGTIDMIEIDDEETLEYSFGLLYSKLVKTKKIELVDLINLMSYNPSDYFGLNGGEIINFDIANVAVFNIHTSDRINKGIFKSNYSQAKCLALVVDGEIVFYNN
jgi:hypothetical protein